MFVVVFFFQAEDGIRDLVRSRGLGDVYKRQVAVVVVLDNPGALRTRPLEQGATPGRGQGRSRGAVSYTHLTLPTSDLV